MIFFVAVVAPLEMAGIVRNLRKFGALLYEYFDFGNKELAMITAKRKQAEIDLARAIKVRVFSLSPLRNV